MGLGFVEMFIRCFQGRIQILHLTFYNSEIPLPFQVTALRFYVSHTSCYYCLKMSQKNFAIAQLPFGWTAFHISLTPANGTLL